MHRLPRTTTILLSAFLATCRCVAPAQDGAGPTASPAKASPGRPEFVLQTGHSIVASSIVCTPNGRYVVTGSSDGTAALWEIATGRKLHVYRHSAPVSAVAVSPDGELLATVGGDQYCAIWRLVTGEMVRRFAVTEKGGQLSSVAFSPDGKLLLTGADTGHIDHAAHAVRLWNPSDGSLVRQLEGGKFTGAVRFSPDGRLIASGDLEGVVTVWEAASAAKLDTLNVTKGAGRIGDLAFGPDGDKLAVVSRSSSGEESELSLWDLPQGRKLRSASDTRRHYMCVEFSSDGKRLISGGRNLDAAAGEVRRWNLDCEPQQTTVLADTYEVHDLAAHPDRKPLFIATDSGPIECDGETPEKTRRYCGRQDYARAVVFLPQEGAFVVEFDHALLA